MVSSISDRFLRVNLRLLSTLLLVLTYLLRYELLPLFASKKEGPGPIIGAESGGDLSNVEESLKLRLEAL